MPTTIGKKIKKIRESKGITLEELGKVANSSGSYIWAIENHPNKKPSAEILLPIARKLEVSLEYLADNSISEDEEYTESSTPSLKNRAFFRKYEVLSERSKKTIKNLVDQLNNDGS